MNEERNLTTDPEREAKRDKLQEFIERCCRAEIPEDELKDVVGILVEVYSDGVYRHRYSEIYFLFNDITGDFYDIMHKNLVKIENSPYFQKMEEQDCFRVYTLIGHIKRASVKLFDTLELEYYRLMKFRELEKKLENINFTNKIDEIVQNATDKIETSIQAADDAEKKAKEASEEAGKASTKAGEASTKAGEASTKAGEASTKAEEASTKAEKASKEAKEASEDAKRVNAQSMSTLGVFTAIMFAFSGGFSLIGSAFQAIQNITRNEMLIMVSLVLFIGCLISDIIFMLMWFLWKINFNKKNMNEREEMVAGVETNKNDGAKTKAKKPGTPRIITWVIILNVVFAFVIVVTLWICYNCATPKWKSEDNANYQSVSSNISFTVSSDSTTNKSVDTSQNPDNQNNEEPSP